MSYRIVVADKDPRSHEAVKRFLPQGNEFVSVSSSAELKQAIKAEKPDLIILNSVLADSPGWNAVEKVVKVIKSSRDYSTIPVVILGGDPGSPRPDVAQGAGADGYLSKPIDAATLKQTVESLLGLSEPIVGDSEEIMLDFSDDDSGDMTEELLAMSNVALDSEEPSTGVGDTVEIDTGTLVAELDHSGELSDGYEDTVRLNLEDMGLDVELDEGTSIEPTIELVDDVIQGAAAPSSQTIELELDSEEALPDFSAITKEIPPEPAGKDSITVDMDMDELGLELEEESLESAGEEIQQIEVDDAEIEKILEVQEPSQVLMSEDIFDSESLVRDTTQVDIIELEDETELREMELEELESVSTDSSLGFDLDDTVPVEDIGVDQISPEDLAEIDLTEAEGASLELESPLDSAQPHKSVEELVIEEEGPEELTTQEFFGEELPTEEFPTERLPEDKTREHVEVEEISLGEAAGPDVGVGEIPLEEMTLDTSIGEEFFEQVRGDEPVLEVTEDILFGEITTDEEGIPQELPKTKDSEPPKQAEVASDVTKLATAAAAAGIVAAAVGSGLKEHKAEIPGPTAVNLAPLTAAAGFVQPSEGLAKPSAVETTTVSDQTAQLQVTPDLLREIKDSILGELKQIIPARTDLISNLGTTVQESLLPKAELSEMVAKAVQDVLPSRQEIIDEIVKNFAATLPSREELSSKVDAVVSQSIPASEALAERIGESLNKSIDWETIPDRIDGILKAAAPTDEINNRFTAVIDRIDAIFKAIPPQEEIVRRFDQTLGALPETGQIIERLDNVMSAIPSPEEIQNRFGRLLEAFPKPEAISTKIDEALSAIPSQADIFRRIDETFAGLPTREAILERIDDALKSIPTKEEIQGRLDQLLAALPAPETISDRIDAALKAIPSRQDINARFTEALSALPSAEEIRSKFEEALQAVPNRNFFKEQLDKSISSVMSPELVLERLDTALRGLPSPEYIRIRLDNAFAALPSADMLEAKIDRVLATFPGPQLVIEKLEKLMSNFPTQEEIASRIDAFIASLPTQEMVLARIEEKLTATMPAREDIHGLMKSLLENRINQMLSLLDIQETVTKLMPSTDKILNTMISALPEKERFQQILTQSLTEAVSNSLPERVWLESVSRGLFDERTRGILPKREELVELLRDEIRSKFLDVMEKAIRAQIEKLSMDFP